MSDTQSSSNTRSPIAMLQPSRNYEKLCKHFEGLYLEAYDDGGGTFTIGWGHIKGVKPGDVCDEPRAQRYFDEDTAEALGALRRQIEVPLSQGEFDAVLDFIFNEGEGHFESSTARRLINAGKYEDGFHAFLMWDKMGHKTVRGLLDRRRAEIMLATTGALPQW
jgi:lysozyme